MTARRTLTRRVRTALILAPVAFLTACAKVAPQSALDPSGDVARTQHNLFKPVFWIATFVFFFVEILFIYAIVKFRDRGQADEPKQIHGNAKLEFTWTLIPALILLGIAIPTVATIFDLSGPPKANAVRVNVIGHQWWWEYKYLDTDPEIVTANTLVIPTGREVFLTLDSADVIHSFWVPRLAGKQDVVPGRTNTLRIIADAPGTYEGQCAEFCAVSHAQMRLRVKAVTPSEYTTWLASQQRPAAEPTDAEAIEGKRLFMSNSCVGCHAIGGTDAKGLVGPNLTHLADRDTFGIPGVLETNLENMIEWIERPRDLKPGVVMPNFEGQLTPQEIRAIAAYLLTLK